MHVSWHALGAGPRQLRPRLRAVRQRDGPRVLPALRRPQGGVRDRGDLRAARGAVRARRGRGPAGAPVRERRRRRRAASATCSSWRSAACWAARPSGRRRSWPNARRRSSCEVNGDRLPYRQSAVTQANEADPERRAAIEEARLDALDTRAEPAAPARPRARPRAGAGARLGQLPRDVRRTSSRSTWPRSSARRAHSWMRPRTPTSRPSIRTCAARSASGSDELRRSDLPYFFRARGFDDLFPAERLIEALERTLAGLGHRARRAAATCSSTPSSAR